MSLDQTKNFCMVEVSIGYNDVATSIVLKAGNGANLPDPTSGEYNLVWYDSTTYPNPADDPNVEIIRVTALSTDTLTVTRNQESSGASTKNTADKTYKMILSLTKKMVDDIATDLAAGGGGAFTLDTAVVRQDVSGAGTYATDDFVFGSPSLDDDGTADHDARMFFDKSHYAFRAGHTSATDWDSRGYASAAFGTDCRATGSGCFAAGSGSDATSNYCVAMGNGNVASGANSTSLGTNCTASGTRSFTAGYGNTAAGSSSFACGIQSSSYLYAQIAQAAIQFSSLGDAQYSRVVLRADTTDETPEVIYINNSSSNKLVLPADRVWRVDGSVIATTEDSAATASWTIKGVIRRDTANNTTLDWSAVTEDYDGITTAAEVTLSADDTNEALSVNITGKAATNIRWVATVNLTEVGY